MPEVSQIMYKVRELTTMLLRDNGIHDGHWMLSTTFQFNAGNAGPTEDDIYPSAIVSVSAVGIQRVPQPTQFTVDAAKVNPPKTDS